MESTLKFLIAEAEKFPLLSPEEELVLARRYQAGNEDARKKLILSNQRWALKWTFIFQDWAKCCNCELVDVFQQGKFGLIEAVDRFDPEMGFKLSTYATEWIKKEIVTFLKGKGNIIHIPVHTFEQYTKIAETQIFLMEQGIEKPSLEEIGSAIGLTPERVSEILRAFNSKMGSLDAKLYKDDSGSLTLLDRTEDPNQDINRINRDDSEFIKQVVEESDLKPIQKTIILRYFFGKESETLEEIGKSLPKPISKQGVSDHIERAFFALKKIPEIKKIAEEFYAIKTNN